MPPEIVLHTAEGGTIKRMNYDKKPEHIYDVIVAGLGTSGSISAICLAQDGFDTLGIDRLPGLGGLGVYGCVWAYYFGSPGGRFETINEFARSLYNAGYTASEPNDGVGEIVYFWDPVNGHSLGTDRYIPGALKEYSLEQAALKAGCSLSLNSSICGVFTQNGAVCGVRYIKEGQFFDVFAKVIVDALGDAYVSFLAGSPIEYGRRLDNIMMKFSKAYCVLNKGLVQPIWSNGEPSEKLGVRDLTAELLRITLSISLRSTDESRIVFEASLPGLRENGHIKSLSAFKFSDYVDGIETSEPLFYLFAPLDNVNVDTGFESRAHQDWSFICDVGDKYMFSIGVSKDMMFPTDQSGKAIGGLITIGSGTGMDHDMSTGFRMKKDYEKMGEAAAIIAEQAIKTGCLPHEVSYSDIKNPLINSGCLSDERNPGLVYFFEKDGVKNKKAIVPAKEQEIMDILESDQPGLAYWAVRRSKGQLFTNQMISRMSLAGNYRGHYAIAAALAGSEFAAKNLLEVLRASISSDKQFEITPDTIRYCVLLGRSGDMRALKEVMNTLGMLTKAYFENAGKTNTYTFVEQYSLLLISLYDLCKGTPGILSDCEKQIKEKLCLYRDREEYEMLIGMLDKLFQYSVADGDVNVTS